MAIAASSEFDVRPGSGDDTFGGFFNTAASGTDRSQQTSAQVVINNSTITCTTPGANSNTLTFTAGYTPSAADVGNGVQMSGGTNINTGFYEISGPTGTTWTLAGATNLTTAGGAGSAITGKMGGCLNTIAKADSVSIAGNKVHIKNSTSTLTVAISLTNAGDDVNGYVEWRGYDLVHNDNTGNRPTITSATASVNLVDLNGKDHRRFYNIQFTHTGSTRGNALAAVSANTSYIAVDNCVFDGVKSAMYGANVADFAIFSATVVNCEIKNCTAEGLRLTTNCVVSATPIHNCTNDGIYIGNNSGNQMFTVVDCPLYSNGGRGIRLHLGAYVLSVSGCDIYNNTLDGIFSELTSSQACQVNLINNTFVNNGAFGAKFTNTPIVAINAYNAYYNNTSGARSNLSAGTGDVTLSGVPYANAPTDFTVTVASGLRGAGFPGALKVGGTGYRDIGTLQHQDPPAGPPGACYMAMP